MKFKKYASKKVISIILTTLVLTNILHQQARVNQLEKELYIQQNIVENKFSHTQTVLFKDTIQERLNELCEYKVLDGTVNIKHSFDYTRDGFLGLKHNYKLTGTADFYYSYVINLSNAEVIKATDNKIIIKMEKPYIDKNSCHRVANSFYKIEDESSNNLLSNKDDAEKCTRKWEDTFDEKGISFINDYYNTYSMQNKINNTTIDQMKKLLNELGYSQSLEIKF